MCALVLSPEALLSQHWPIALPRPRDPLGHPTEISGSSYSTPLSQSLIQGVSRLVARISHSSRVRVLVM